MRTPKNQKPRLPLTVLAVFLLPVLIFAGAIVDSAASAAEAEGTRAGGYNSDQGFEFLSGILKISSISMAQVILSSLSTT